MWSDALRPLALLLIVLAGGSAQAAGRCEALAELKPADAALTLTASPVAAGFKTERARNGSGGNELPAHCLVRGTLNARTGADGKPYGIGFELRLPDASAWNGRFFFQGGGGNDGVLRVAEGTIANLGGTSALQRGFAVASTDSGHLIDRSSPDFGDSLYGLDPQARIDFGYSALEQVARLAKTLIAGYYAKPADKSYFAGCSNGGRQGFVAAQRFPDLFDGIVAGDPAFAILQARIASFWQAYAVKDLATAKDAKGRPDLSTAMSDADLKLLNDHVIQQCDALDGLKDGLIDNLPACRIDPAKLQCQGDKNERCLSAAQVSAVKTIYAGPVDSKGRPLYAPQPPGSELAWRMWLFGRPGQPPGVMGSEGMFKYMAFTPPRTAFDFYGFDFDADPPLLSAAQQIYQATSTDFSAFKLHGGKLLIYHGTADPAQSTLFLTGHFDQIQRDNGGADVTQGFARLFLVPGMEHCFGGSALDKFDPLTPLVDWVEKGVAPAGLTATGASFPGRSRPLCPYPKRSTYLGSGSTDAAENFVCR